MTGVPTQIEESVLGTLEQVERTKTAHCRLCDEPIDVSHAENWGDVFEALAEHGEERDDHVYEMGHGWRFAEGEEVRGGER